MEKNIDVKVSNLMEILDNQVKKVDAVSKSLHCLIEVLKKELPPDQILFRISPDQADDRQDPCCGGCHGG
jgi:hypothetical protein